jgi:hypothetical protein
MLLSVTAYAQKPVHVLGPGLNSGRTPYYQNYDRTLSADTVYTLTGLYYVDSLYSITIPPGTVVLGDTAATLIVSRGAQIHACGTEQRPIVFSSLKDPGMRGPGDWGGIILLGQAPVNKYEPLIEGGIIGGSYGGIDPDDSSGELCYVRIEFPGYRFQLNNEVNGLTMGAVGNGTVLHHIQVSYSFDDSYEWFGGTVDGRYLVAFGGTDDEFDTDFGYQGKIQFGFGLRDPFLWDPTGQSNGFESDNDGSSTSTDEPHTHPVFSNITLIGPKLYNGDPNPPIGHSYQYAAVLRRSTQTSVFNSIIGGYPWGISNRDIYTHYFSMINVLDWQNVSIASHEEKVIGSGSVHGDDRWAPDSCTLWFDTAGDDNLGTAPRYLPDIGINMTSWNYPDPVPAVGSEPDGSAEWSSPQLADPFFSFASYRGAFDPTVPFQLSWCADWTNFNPQWTVYNPHISDADNESPSAKAKLANFPNPFNPATIINFSVPKSGHVTLKVFDVAGKEVATLIDKSMDAGTYDTQFVASHLASGTYFYRLTGNGFEVTNKMILLR